MKAARTASVSSTETPAAVVPPGEVTLAKGTAADFPFVGTWPQASVYGPGKRPRSATIAITREDGGVIGL